MLGKCIKNEFVNRIGQVASLLIGILIFSGVVALLNAIKPSISNEYMNMFIGLVNVLFMIAMMIVVFALIFLPCTDFSNRFFKDQGYLTHTLPVKTSTLVVARMICDIVMVTLLAVVYPLCICIATRNFDFFGELIYAIEQFFAMGGGMVERSMLVMDGILMIVSIWLGVLSTLWSINTAYSFGHAFSKHKRLMSVLGYIGLMIICFLLTILASEIFSMPGVISALENISESINTEAGAFMIIFLAIDTVELIAVAVLAVATSWICKHKLNLE